MQLCDAIEFVERFAVAHPDLCPHKYEWQWSEMHRGSDHTIEHYRCKWCGCETQAQVSTTTWPI